MNILGILKVVDFIPLVTYQKLNMLGKIEVVAPLGMNAFMLLQPYPDEESHLDVTVKPFQISV